jgi:predicted transcriptional regulator
MNRMYAYCISENPDELMIKGIQDLPVEMMQQDELCLLYSPVNKEIKYIEENFLAHENVLEIIMKKGISILPFRFGTYLSEEDGKNLLNEKYTMFLEKLIFLRGKVEMSVRAIWNYDHVFKEAKNNFTAPKIDITNEKISKYLSEKMKDYKLKEYINHYASLEAERIHKDIIKYEFSGKYILMKTDSMFFNASYLVETNKMSDFHSRIQRVISDFTEYKFLITGPWPPYNFCNLIV